MTERMYDGSGWSIVEDAFRDWRESAAGRAMSRAVPSRPGTPEQAAALAARLNSGAEAERTPEVERADESYARLMGAIHSGPLVSSAPGTVAPEDAGYAAFMAGMGVVPVTVRRAPR